MGNGRGDDDGWVDLGALSFRMVFELFSNGFRDWPREKRAGEEGARENFRLWRPGGFRDWRQVVLGGNF